MDDLVAVHDLFDELFCLGVIHVPDLLDAVFICLHEVFKLGLKISELFGQLFVLDRQILVGLLRLLLLCVVTFDDLPLDLLVPTLFLFLILKRRFVDTDLLLQHPIVEVQLLFVELIDGLHVLHTLLKNLHLLLQLDFLLRLIVGVLVAEFFELLCVLFLHLGPSVGLGFLGVFVLLEEIVDLLLVGLEDLGPLIFEGLFDRVHVRLVRFARVFVLLLHRLDQVVDVVVHLGHRLDVLLILALQLLHELLDEVFLLLNDLLALLLLSFDFLRTSVT